MEELPPPPPPWIEQYQREHLTGVSALTTFQGLISDELILPRGAVEAKDPVVLAEASVAFVNSMRDEAQLLPGEFAQEALWSFHAMDYVTQATQSGHVHYFAHHGDDDLGMKLAQFGLKSMVADPQLALFTEFVKLQRLDPRDAKKAAVKAGFRDVKAQIADIDRRLNELEQADPIKARHKIWLKSLRKVRVVPDEEWRAALSRVATSNPLNAQRRAERERVQAENLARDPAFQLAKSLCEQEGGAITRFAAIGRTDIRSIWPEGPKLEATAWQVTTNRGPRTALVYEQGGFSKKRQAVLIEPGAPLPTGSATLTQAEFDQISG